MSDPNADARLNLADALRALPLAKLDGDPWARLAAELAPAARPRRRWAPLALAAGVAALALAFALLRFAPQVATPATAQHDGASDTGNGNNAAIATSAQSVPATAANDARLAALQTRSQALERWLDETRDQAAPLPAQDLAAAAEIENMIGLVDVQLSATERADATGLWQRRVNLLEDLTALRYSNDRLAGSLASNANGAAPNRIN
jgi:hypothetical protein